MSDLVLAISHRQAVALNWYQLSSSNWKRNDQPRQRATPGVTHICA